MRRSFQLISFCLVVGLQVHAASDKLGTFVVVGDSLTAGFQNFSLYTSETATPPALPGGILHGYAHMIADQAGKDLSDPTVLYPGLPPALTLNPFSPAGQISRAPLPPGFRLNPGTQTLNLSVPSYTVADALGRQIDLLQIFSNPLLANPQDLLEFSVLAPPNFCGALDFPSVKVTLSSIACAAQLKADTVLVSLGSNDALQAMTFGIPPTSAAAFAGSYHDVVTKLRRAHARLLLANVPDVTAIPYVWTQANFNNRCNARGIFLPDTLKSTDYIVPNFLDPTASGDVCDNYVVRSGDLVQAAKDAATAYNGIIAAEAKDANILVFDVNGLFRDIAANGVTIGGKHLTTAFLGGLFSLDGMHPTNTGNAIMANKAIETMNNSPWHTSIPTINVERVAATDPLIF